MQFSILPLNQEDLSGVTMSTKSFSVAFSLALLISAPRAQAQTPVNAEQIRRDFTANAKSLPQKLSARGYNQVGQINTYNLINSIERIDTRVMRHVQHVQVSGDFNFARNSAEWRSGGSGRISLNGPRWQQTQSKFKPMLALHESLGALGFSDDGFACSS